MIQLKHHKPCILISHSLGSVLIANFLQSKCQTWKDKYVNSWVSINGAFGGAMDAAQALFYGELEQFPSDNYSNSLLLKASRSFPTFYSLLPSPSAFGKDYVFIIKFGVDLI